MGKSILQKPRYLNEVSQQSQTSSVSAQISKPKAILSSQRRKERTPDQQENRDLDKEYLVRALSHDIGAHLMILEYSFRHYDEQAKKMAAECLSLPDHNTSHSMISFGKDQVRLRQDIAGTALPPHKEAVFQSSNELVPRMSKAPPESPSAMQITLNEAASHVTACIDEMKRFVKELISFAKTGNIDMEPTSVQVADIVHEVLFEQHHLLEKRKIHVVVSSPLPTVFANPMRIKQMLTNLIRNAAIHGCDMEHPMILMASEIVPNNVQVRDAMVCFSIRDNGGGIPQKELQKIFDPGYRVPGNQNEGSGIGLATVKKIANYYGGNIVCESHEGETVFTVTLPKG